VITESFEDSDGGTLAVTAGTGTMTSRAAAGDVLFSPVSDARFLVTDPGAAAAMPSVDDVPLILGTREPCSKAVHFIQDDGLQGGQRYVDAVTGLTLLCIWPGRGSLGYQGRRLSPASPRKRRVAAPTRAPI
jgi:hypothetical protein